MRQLQYYIFNCRSCLGYLIPKEQQVLSQLEVIVQTLDKSSDKKAKPTPGVCSLCRVETAFFQSEIQRVFKHRIAQSHSF